MLEGADLARLRDLADLAVREIHGMNDVAAVEKSAAKRRANS
jgi:hypothetical protein